MEAGIPEDLDVTESCERQRRDGNGILSLEREGRTFFFGCSSYRIGIKSTRKACSVIPDETRKNPLSAAYYHIKRFH